MVCRTEEYSLTAERKPDISSPDPVIFLVFFSFLFLFSSPFDTRKSPFRSEFQPREMVFGSFSNVLSPVKIQEDCSSVETISGYFGIHQR